MRMIQSHDDHADGRTRERMNGYLQMNGEKGKEEERNEMMVMRMIQPGMQMHGIVHD